MKLTSRHKSQRCKNRCRVRSHSDGPESDESDVSCSGDDDSSEDADCDVGQYLYLKGAMHYNSEDIYVYKRADVVPEDFGDGAALVV